MASSPWSGPLDLPTGAGVPVYPVGNTPRYVEEADPIIGLGIKAGLGPIAGTT